MSTDRAYQQLWRVVDGAVRDAFRKHGDYLTPKGRHSAKRSVVKRVTGTVLSFALQEAKRQRELAVTDARVLPGEHQAAGVTPAAEPDACSRPATHSHAHVNEACYQAIRRALFPVRRTRAIRRDAQAFKNAKAATTAMLERGSMREAEIHRAVVAHWRALGLPGTLVATLPNMGAMGQHGLTKGLPDLLVIGGNVKIGFIELKAENGRTSKPQIAFRETCATWDIPCVVTWGRDEPITLLEQWNIVRRAA